MIWTRNLQCIDLTNISCFQLCLLNISAIYPVIYQNHYTVGIISWPSQPLQVQFTSWRVALLSNNRHLITVEAAQKPNDHDDGVKQQFDQPHYLSSTNDRQYGAKIKY